MIKDKYLNLIKKYSDDESFNSECWNEIENNYSAKTRYYHNLEHLENMFRELDKVKSNVKDLDTLSFAIYYHDTKQQRTSKCINIQEKNFSNVIYKFK